MLFHQNIDVDTIDPVAFKDTKFKRMIILLDGISMKPIPYDDNVKRYITIDTLSYHWDKHTND